MDNDQARGPLVSGTQNPNPARVEITIYNDMPEATGYVIDRAGASFLDAGGAEERVEPVDLDVRTGHFGRVFSRSADKCVKQVVLTLYGHYPGQAQHPIQGQSRTADKCWVTMALHLRPDPRGEPDIILGGGRDCTQSR